MCVKRHLAFYLPFYVEDILERLDHLTGKICTYLTFLCLEYLFYFLDNSHQVQELYQYFHTLNLAIQFNNQEFHIIWVHFVLKLGKLFV